MLIVLISATIFIIILFIAVFCIPKEGLTMYHCSAYNGGEMLNTVLKKLHYQKTSNKKADLYIPCGYTGVEKELEKHTPSENQKILAIDGCDKIVAKDHLWQTLVKEYGREGAKQLTPESFLCRSAEDMRLLQSQHRIGDLYIMKKNVQRQQGLKITSEPQEIKNSTGYVVVQRYITNPLLIDNRKFDIRVFMLIVQKDNRQYYYRHSGGRCHYAGKDFTTTDLNDARHIPSGYNEDTKFKDQHPETLQELQEYMRGYGDLMFSRLDENLRKCARAFSRVLGKRFPNNVCAQLFGLDFVFTDNLHPFLIEINKGPEMSTSSEKEYSYKTQIVNDMIQLLDNPHAKTDFFLIV